MKKVIFKGTINGKEFNDVKSYNAEINKLTDEGAAIQASTSTQIVDTIENEEKDNLKKCTCECCDCHKSENLILPGFDRKNHHYIDDLVDKDTDKFENKVSRKEEYMDNMFDTIINHMKSDPDLKLKYEEAIKNIMNILADDKETNKHSDFTLMNHIKNYEDEIDKLGEKIDDLCNQLDDLYNKQDILNQAGYIIEMYKDYYDDIMNEFKKNKSEKQDKQPKTEMKEKNSIKEINDIANFELTPEQEAALKNILFNLWY